MPAYVIAIRGETDAEAYAAYGKKAALARADHKITPRVRTSEVIALEGEPAEGIVMLEFPSVDEAKAWFNSPAYQEARKERVGKVDYRFLLVQGLES
ncbi:MAG: DUF1330 domain-containing protein [Phenylobacterium sp.]|uniref:DUF1330 domain-containing protein n=1 Tax=Phenylobacterium sp. TaxID=1871053 RepID=UPI0027338881|nr:DUF1330 domain-containing protein [Phenylobacterium sp.]MDP3174970.1 DUF1330 domain-containing protein [Phenylobacterium sp.]